MLDFRILAAVENKCIMVPLLMSVTICHCINLQVQAYFIFLAADLCPSPLANPTLKMNLHFCTYFYLPPFDTVKWYHFKWNLKSTIIMKFKS